MVAVDARPELDLPRRGSATRRAAVLLALRYYGRELVRLRAVAVPGAAAAGVGQHRACSTWPR